ncbi:MAG: hypothetical protein RL095_960 [Verrucomicrobiota bacterium]
MRTINLYIARNLLWVFTISIAVLIFVMLAGNILRLIDKLTHGLDPMVFFDLMMAILPGLLGYALPVALLVAVTLVYSRMSAESEITAMRASGISVWQITTPAILLSLAVSAACFWLQVEAISDANLRRDTLIGNLASTSPAVLLESGTEIELGNQLITIDERQGNELKGVRLVQSRDGVIEREILAETATLIPDEKGPWTIQFHSARILTSGGFDDFAVKGDGRKAAAAESKKSGSISKDSKPEGAQAERMNRIASGEIGLKFDPHSRVSDNLRRKFKYLDAQGLLSRIANMDDRIATLPKDDKKALKALQKERGNACFRLNKNLALALAPLSFLLLALPFSFRSARSETSVGLVISLFILMGYFGMNMAIEMLPKTESFKPWILIWVPNLVYQAAGIWLLARKVRG